MNLDRSSHLFLFVLITLHFIHCDEHDHKYEDGSEVVLWMNTVGPYHNRQETYNYFSLPFCRGIKKEISHYHETLGENILGVELEYSGVEINFKRDKLKSDFCEVTLTPESYDTFIYAIKNHYWYQMFIDDLPIWGIVGEMDEAGKSVYIWTHKKFEIGYNNDRIIDVNLTSEAKVRLQPNVQLQFSYEVIWKPTNIQYMNRFDKYLDPGFFQHKIHWFSIFNSFMMVLFLVGLVSMILLRTLRKDYARYGNDELDPMESDLGDEYGWKQVHGDVFRPPAHPILFASLIGSGYQIATVSTLCILITILFDIYTERALLFSTAIFLYAASSIVNGYAGGSLYARMKGQLWIKQLIVGAFLVPAVICGVTFLVNFISIYYGSSRSIPFTVMLSVTAICLFIILPLTAMGTVLGRNISGEPNNPCRTNAVPRPIPEKKWFMEPNIIILASGILPFGSIFIEMYFIFTSFWAYKIYYVYGFMLLVFLILAVVTVCVTIVATYFMLNAEDYRWQWTSFLSGASSALYVYLYAMYYFFFKTKMYGMFQTVFYFGYMALFSLGLGIMCGTFGYIGTQAFVRKIYSIKID
ncbi:unnamed protein product [Rotaria socialis]|uniref:Transmembrane 9 superfamily member n=1 Tax=Rotaria socialis TaxID=392032 RepID=A0A820HZ31_9BILA|nr:unnamed protein product [Rotaria socialis]CAF3413705.1 unnamed protein product [Rotaria socialis]CAF3436788.1 unnamed protein product [Rotaria socialis]CAF3472971.1 unnamed protein product [Rotaria socialis]CAF4301342.1 unnamed protein product [Rotaria socialis]